MKIIEISFTNINNLKGSHKVSFDELPLKSAGIFAILGPTGSGKSTLLDVITLALFNKIPRFGKSISKNEMITQGSVLTHHTSEANACISYKINGQSYISKWSVSKTKKGKLKDYEMTLQTSDGQYLDLKKSEVPEKNEKIIGLKYDQFVKAIILSQGEFAKFLKADKNERGKLLENLTGTHIYRKIGEQVFLKHKEVKETVEAQLQRIEDIILLNEKERTELEGRIKDKEEEQTRLDTNIKALRKQKTTKENLNKLNANLQEKNKADKILNFRIEQFSSNNKKLEQHDKVLPLNADIVSYKETKNNTYKTNENLKRYKSELEAAQEGLHNTIQKMSRLTKEDVTKDNFKNVMTIFEDKVKDLVNARNTNKSKGEDLRKRINELKAEFSYPLDNHPEKALGDLELIEQKKSVLIRKAQISLEEDINIHVQRLKDLKASKENYQSLSTLSKAKSDLQNTIETKQEKTKELLPISENAKTMLKDLEIKLNDKIKIEELLQQQLEDALKIASLEEYRVSLKEGDACPLCGSADHPYTVHLPEKEQSGISKKIAAAKLATAQIRKEKSTLEQQRSSAIAKLELNRKDIAQHQEYNKNKQAEIQKLLEKYSELEDNLEAIDPRINQISDQINNLDAAIEAVREIKVINSLRKEYEALKAIIVSHKEIVAKKNLLYEGDNPTEECNNLQDNFNNFENSIQENTKAISRESADLVRADKLLALASAKLKPHLKDLEIPTIEELSELLLNEETLNSYKEEKVLLNNSRLRLNTEIENIRTEIKAHQNNDVSSFQLTEISDELEKKQIKRDNLIKEIQDILGKIKLDDEHRLKKKNKEEEINKLRSKLEQWHLLNKLIGDANGNKFANFAQGLTLQNLLVFTNKRLKHLSDRYILDKPASDSGPLRVVDQYQGNIERGVNTLSGGETFLISLALALSLSDMASRNVSLDSLFIDEGFGTLDQETLEIALNTLEKLQSESQKTVGVISHVEALKERIHVQIVMEKNAQGYSKLKIVS